MQTTTSKSENLTKLIQNYRFTTNLMIKHSHSVLDGNVDININTVVLMHALDPKGTVSQHDIAHRLQISDAAISRQIALLTKKDYIIAKQDPSNRRKVLISMSPKGAKLLKTADRLINEELERVLADLPADQLQSLTDASTVLKEHLTTATKK